MIRFITKAQAGNLHLDTDMLVGRYVMQDAGMLWEEYRQASLVIAGKSKSLVTQRVQMDYVAGKNGGLGGFELNQAGEIEEETVLARVVRVICDTPEECVQIVEHRHLSEVLFTRWKKERAAALHALGVRGLDAAPLEAPPVPQRDQQRSGMDVMAEKSAVDQYRSDLEAGFPSPLVFRNARRHLEGLRALPGDTEGVAAAIEQVEEFLKEEANSLGSDEATGVKAAP